jgi:hypothetical protein
MVTILVTAAFAAIEATLPKAPRIAVWARSSADGKGGLLGVKTK